MTRLPDGISTRHIDAPPPAAPMRPPRQRRAWYLYTWGAHAFPTTVVAVFVGPYLTDVAERAAGGSGHDVHPLGLPVRAESFYPYVVAAAVILEVLVVPLLGAVADRGRRRRLLTCCMVVGATATIGFLAVTGDRYLLGGALLIVATVAFGATSALSNGYLTELAPPDRRDGVSARGWAIGYLGGGLLLAVNVVLYASVHGAGAQRDMARLSLASAGVWWLVFGALGLRGLPDGRPVTRRAGARPGRTAFEQLGATLRSLAGNRAALLFLVAFIAYNEGIQTVISFASTYGRKQLDLPLTTLTSAILLVQFVAFGGALLLGRLAARFGARPTVLGSLVVWVVLLMLAFGMTPGVAWQFYALGAAIGLVLGGSQALSRSLFAQMVPPGAEGEYFGIYELSQSGTSWVGSLTIGLVLQFTGSYRWSIASLVVFFALGGALLARARLPDRHGASASQRAR